MKPSLPRLALSFFALAFVVPAAVFGQKTRPASEPVVPVGPIVIPSGSYSTTFVINEPGSYVLGGHRVMTDAGQHAIEITAADVTLDLAGFSLRFTATSGLGSGISIPQAVNVEIRNGAIVSTASYAIKAEGAAASGVRLVDLRISDTVGIFSTAANTLVERCQIIDSRSSAITLKGIGGVVRHSQIQSASHHGIDVAGASSLITGNVVANAQYFGISLHANQGAGVISDNVVSNANVAGYNSVGGINQGPRVTVKNNFVYGARGYGIVGLSGSGVVEGNTVNNTTTDAAGNGGHGIYTTSSVIRNNSGIANAGDLVTGPIIDGGGNFGH